MSPPMNIMCLGGGPRDSRGEECVIENRNVFCVFFGNIQSLAGVVKDIYVFQTPFTFF